MSLWEEQKALLEHNLDQVRRWMTIAPDLVNRHVRECVRQIDEELTLHFIAERARQEADAP